MLTAMTNKAKRTIGLILAALGMVLLILNALDYVMRWNQISSAFTAIGIMLVLIGSGLARRSKDDGQEQKKP